LLQSYDNLTFDGSSIKGFSRVRESDLRLEVDWGSFRWLPSDIFGPGKVITFGVIKNQDGSIHDADFRGKLKEFSASLFEEKRLTANVSVECEGFLFEGLSAEQNYSSREGFKLVSRGGYFNSLPKDSLKTFIDSLAEAQRALAFQNEKDHPEVAPSQFELNYRYCDALLAADQVQLYKLIARQVAANMGMTASFLPKPIAEINGSGMHCNLSLAEGEKNLFYDKAGELGLSDQAWSFVDRILHSAGDMCLALNSSVNSYRRLDPRYEAPNQIKVSAVDRTAMVRVPLGNEKSTRIEIRAVAPDANPYLAFYIMLRVGLEGPLQESDIAKRRHSDDRMLPGDMYDAIELFENSTLMEELIGLRNRERYAQLKTLSAHRCPHDLGSLVKTAEILFHHEVTNQHLWSHF